MSNILQFKKIRFIALSLTIIILAALVNTAPSHAQPESVERLQKQKLNFFQRWAIRANGNVEHVFNTDIDGGGKFNITRLGFSHDATFTATDKLKITFGSSYNFYHFDFSGSQGFAGLRPWRNVSISNNSMRVTYAVTQKWGVFAMPVISYGAESGAPFFDSFTIGGMAGVSYRFGDNLTVGIGGFVGSRLEDSVIGYPIGFLDWKITERLRLSTLAAGARNDFGPKAELSYDVGSGFKVATSVGYEFTRFRLEKKGNFPRGIGDFKALPLVGRVSYDVNKYLTLNSYGGFLFLGSLEVEDSDGDRIRKEDYDPAPFLGGSITIRL
ncbi:MAG: hypothetical protein DHS20C13_07360 [Thermodesulfobacteriota bacterium]|nr:MAG: hypothetical protein DHS20C13_07360 [Thermodesulfobacteriota bacterium]